MLNLKREERILLTACHKRTFIFQCLPKEFKTWKRTCTVNGKHACFRGACSQNTTGSIMPFLQTGEREHHQIATGFLTCACHCGRIRFPPEIILFTDTRGGSFLMGVTVRWTFAAALAVRRGFEEPRSAHCQEKRETKLFPGNRGSACL